MGRHGCRAALVAALCILIALLAAPLAYAAPEIGDAGDLPLTAQEPGPAGPLAELSGEIAGPSDRDMYKICLTAGSNFSATTVGTTGFDTQLFLFDEQGRGVYANDDLTSAIRQSELPAGVTIGPQAAGVYYLAISGYDSDPVGPDRVDRSGDYLFPSSSGLVAPVPTRADQPVSGWRFRFNDTNRGGVYRILLSRTRSCIDATPPVVTLRSPDDGAVYAQGAEVPADYDCVDEQDGSGIASCQGDVPDSAPIDTGALGEHSFTVTARDRRGNETVVTHTYTVEDRTAPTVTLTTPLDGTEYERGQEVLAGYQCSDEEGGSALVSCEGDVANGAAIDTSTLGAHSFSVTAADGAGNETRVTHTYRVVDRTAPVVTLTTPPEGAVYARGLQVPAVFQCSDEDGGSGVLSCQGDVPVGSPVDTSTLGAHTFTVVALDNGGNRTEVSHTYTVVDLTAPTIDLRAPSDGATYALGALVEADYDCADDSSLATCAGTVPDGAPIDTATLGDHTFTVSATDAAGNAATRTVTYRVEERFEFDFEGFYWPVLNRPRVNVVKAGWYVPIRFSLDGFHGRDVIADGYPRSREMACGSTADLDGGEKARAAGRWKLRYQRRRDLYIFLWKTDRDWAGECRQFILKLDDGSYHRADFKFPARHRWWHDRWDG